MENYNDLIQSELLMAQIFQEFSFERTTIGEVLSVNKGNKQRVVE